MSDEILFDGVRYISASEAAQIGALTRDYVARLCKEGRLPGRRVGKQWYVSKGAFELFLTNQQYARAQRRQDLIRKRQKEYGVAALLPHSRQFARELHHGGNESDVLRALPRASSYARAALASAVRSPATISAARAISSAPVHAVSFGKHVSAHALPPISDALHKLLAIVTALLFTIGTYIFVDAQYARLTDQAPFSGRASQFAAALIDSGREQLALASQNPTGTVSGYLGNLARAVNRRVDSLVYGIMFPPSLIEFADNREVISVRVSVRPVAPSAPSIARSGVREPARAESVERFYAEPARSELVEPVKRVIERVVETQRIVASAGGLTEEILTQRLNALDSKLTAQIFSVGAQTPAVATTIVQQATAGATRIDDLSKITLRDSTITGGSISGTSASLTSLSVSGSATSTFGGGLQATSLYLTSSASSTLSGGLIISGGCVEINGTCLTSGNPAVGGDTSVQFSDNGSLAGSSAFTFSSSTSLLKVTNASTTLFSAFDRIYVGGSATTTIRGDGFASTIPFASSTALTVSGIAYFSTASTTNLILQYASSTALTVSGTSWLDGGLLAYASSTIGSGTQAGGLTISGGATTTGYLVVQGSATSTFSSGLSSTYLNITGTSATSTFARGIDLAGGCFSVNGTCLKTSTDLLSSANAWSALQTFSSGLISQASSTFTGATFLNGGASTTQLTNSGTTWLTSLSSAILGVDNTGKVVASTTIGSNLLKAPASSILAGNENGAVIASTTIGWNLLKGAASSIFAFDESGNPTATTSIGANFLSGILPIASGGTNASSFTTTNNSVYYDGTRLVTAGTSQAVTTPFASSTALSISGTGYFATASTTNLTLSGVQHGILSTSQTGAVSASTTIGSNLLKAPASSILAGNENGSIIASTTIGWNLLKGAASSIFAFNENGAPTATTTIGWNFIKGKVSSIFAFDENGAAIATTSIGANLLSGSIANSQLANSSVTINSVGLLTGGGSLSLGGSLTLNASTSPTVGYIFATSSTASNLPYASSTALTVSGNAYLTGLTSALLGTDSTGKVVSTTTIGNSLLTNGGALTVTAGSGLTGGGSVSLGGTITLTRPWDWTLSAYNSQNVNATSTGLWLTGSPLSLVASSTFATQASTTLFTNTGSTWLTSLSSAILGVDNTGKVVASSTIGSNLLNVPVSSVLTGDSSGKVVSTTTIGTNLLKAPASSILAGNENGSIIASTTIGWNLLKGAASSIFAFNENGAPTATTTIGWNFIKGKVSSIFAFDENGAAIATTSIGANLLAGTIANSQLANSSVTINSVGLLTGGGALSLGGSLTLNASTSPTVGYINATSSLASTLPYASSTALTVSSTAYFPGSGIWNSSGNVGIGTTTPWGKLSVTNTGSGPSFVVEDDTSPDSTPFIIDASGNVGVGTASPAGILQVRSSDPTLYVTNTTAANAALYLGNSSEAGSARISFTEATSQLAINAYRGGSAANIAFQTQGVEKARLTDTGNLGIGTTSPGSLLSLNGIANFTTATSTLYGTGGINLAAGCFSVLGTCLETSSDLLSSTNIWSALQTFSSGLLSQASSTFTGVTFLNGGASTTQLTNSGTTWLTSLSSAILGVDNTGKVVASSTIGANLLNVPVSSILAGDSSGKIVASTTIGWNLLKGAASSIFAFNENGAPTATTTIGWNFIKGKVSSIFAFDENGAAIATTSIGANLLSGSIANSQLANSSVTINSVGLLTGGGALSLGGSLTLNASTSPTVGYINATSSLASTLPYASSTALTVSSTAYFPGSGIWNSSGNVGIGTTDPSSGKLVVAGTNPQFSIENTGVSTGWIGISGSDLVIAKESTNDIIFKTGSTYPTGITTGTERLVIDGSTGNVGIGTTTPNTTLNVAKDIDIVNGNTYAQLNVGGSGTTNGQRFLNIGYDTTDNYGLIQSVERGTDYKTLALNPFGSYVGIGTTTIPSVLTIAIPTAGGGDANGVRLTNTATYRSWLFQPGISGVSDNYFQIKDVTAGATRLSINDSGYVGIGITAPGYQLSNNTASNNLDSGSTGLSTASSINWANSGSGYGIGLYNASTNSDANGLLVKIAGTAATNKILSLDTGASQAGAGTNVLTVLGSGNVGIGTVSPGAKLDVSGITGWGNGTSAAAINGANVAAAGGGVLRVLSNDSHAADLGGSIALGGYYIAQTNSLDFAQIAGRKENGTSGNAAGYLQLSTRDSGGNTTEKVRITSTGNVGIGTTSPAYPLAVTGAASGFGGLGTAMFDSASTDTGVVLNNSTAAGRKYILYSSGTASGIGAGNFNIYDNSGGGTRFSINSSGNVGIGTTSPSSKLSVWTNTDNVNVAQFGPTDTDTDGSATVTIQASDNTQNAGLIIRNRFSYNSFITNVANGLQISGTQDGSTPGFYYNGGVGGAYNNRMGFGTIAPTTYFSFVGPSNFALGADLFDVATSTGTSFFHITNAGNVGVGTTTPGNLLTLAGATTPALRIDASNTSSYEALSFYSAGTQKSYLLSPGSAFSTTDRQGDLELVSNSNDISFWPGGSQAVTVKSGGNVGIGTTSPAIRSAAGRTFLTIQGASERGVLELASGSSDADGAAVGQIQFVDRLNTTGEMGVAAINSSLSGSTANARGGVLSFFTRADNVGSGGLSEKMRIDSTGNVGIGTTSPSGTLAVSGSSSNALKQLVLQNTSTGGSQVELQSSVGSEGISLLWDNNNAVGILRSGTGYPLSFRTNGNNERMRITSDGNVGIGTTTPNNALTVYNTSNVVSAFGQSGGAVGIGVLNSATPFIQGYTNTMVNATANLALQVSGGNVGIGTTSPSTLLSLAGTTGLFASTTATSTFQGGGINLLTAAGNTGCFAVNGTCLSNTASGIVGSGTTGQFPYYAANGTTLTATSTLFVSTASNVGVGTVSPGDKLEIDSGNITFDDNYGIWGGGSGKTAGFYTASGGVHFRSGSTDERLVITSTGNVGIGTTSPTDSLHIVDQDNTGIRFDEFNSLDGANIRLRRANGTLASPTGLVANDRIGTITGFGYDSSGAFGTVAAQYGMYAAETFTSSAHGSYLRMDTTPLGSVTAAERMRIDPAGNVGIGTTDPSGARLVVSKATDGAASTNIANLFSTTANDNTYMYFGNSESTGRAGAIGYQDNTDTTSGYTWLSVYGDSASSLVVKKGGNVGIGTTDPQEELHVSGGAATKVRIQTTASNQAGIDFLSSGRDTWVAGNSLTVASAFELYNETDAATRLIIDTSGNVGIGTTTPGGIFQVSKDATYAVDTGAALRLSNVSVPSKMLAAGYDNTIDASYLQSLQSGSSYKSLLLNPSGGNVGIGTTSPAYLVDVYQSSTSGVEGQYPAIRVSNPATVANAAAKIQLDANAGALKGYFMATVGAATPAFFTGSPSADTITVGSVSNSPFQIITGNSPKVYVESGGNVGIGTTTPGTTVTGALEKLSVYGNGIIVNDANTVSTMLGGFNQAASFIGTYSNHPLNIRTNNTTRMYLDTSGNVGIGTTTPNSALNVHAGAFSSEEVISRFSFTNSSGVTRALSVLQPVADGTDSPFTIQTGNAMNFRVDAVDALTIDIAGNVGIGVADAAVKLDIVESGTGATAQVYNTNGSQTGVTQHLLSATAAASTFYFTMMTSDQDGTPDNEFYVRGDGEVRADGTIAGGGADYAEYVTPKPGTVPADYPKGSLICLVTSDPDTYGMCDEANDGDVVGIVSTFPGILGNAPVMSANETPREETHIALAMLGRVPLRVNLEGGAIAIGDRLAASSQPGFAMKATETARTIGLALEAFDGLSASSTSVMAYIEPELTFAGMEIDALGQLAGFSTSDASSTVEVAAGSFMDGFLKNIYAKIAGWFADAANGIGKFFAGSVHTKEICVGDESGAETCITKAQLDTLLAGQVAAAGALNGNNGGNGENGEGEQGGSSPTPVPEQEPAPQPEPTPEPEATPPVEESTPAQEESPSENLEESPPEASPETPADSTPSTGSGQAGSPQADSGQAPLSEGEEPPPETSPEPPAEEPAPAEIPPAEAPTPESAPTPEPPAPEPVAETPSTP